MNIWDSYVSSIDIFFTLEGAPAWISLDGSKMVGQPEQDGEYVFTVSVSDSEYVVSEQFIVHIADRRPEVLSLRDVPNDQGKQMHLCLLYTSDAADE